MKEKAEQGGVPFICPPGYRPIPDSADPLGKRRSVEVDEKRAPLVATMFQLYASGKYSLPGLVAEMNRRGLTLRPALMWPKAGRGPRKLSVAKVHKMLTNPFYIGVVHWKGDDYKGYHQPLVTRRLFNQVQSVLRRHCSYTQPETKKDFTYRHWVTCGSCWKQMKEYEQSGAYKSGRYVYYFCRRPECDNKRHYKELLVVKAIEEAIGQLYIDAPLAARIKARLREASDENDAAERLAAERLAKEEARRINNLKLLYQDRLDGVITAERYKEMAAEIETALEADGAERERLRQTNTKFREEGNAIVDLVRGLKKQYLKADEKGKAAILSVILDKVVLRPNDYYVTFREPFGMFFSMNRVKQDKQKGE
jgi:site-specific DNA recombinase